MKSFCILYNSNISLLIAGTCFWGRNSKIIFCFAPIYYEATMSVFNGVYIKYCKNFSLKSLLEFLLFTKILRNFQNLAEQNLIQHNVPTIRIIT